MTTALNICSTHLKASISPTAIIATATGHPVMELIDTAHKPHDTRHTCISMLTEKEVSPTLIKKIVGHSGAMTLTERVYTHINVQELLGAINKI